MFRVLLCPTPVPMATVAPTVCRHRLHVALRCPSMRHSHVCERPSMNRVARRRAVSNCLIFSIHGLGHVLDTVHNCPPVACRTVMSRIVMASEERDDGIVGGAIVPTSAGRLTSSVLFRIREHHENPTDHPRKFPFLFGPSIYTYDT